MNSTIATIGLIAIVALATQFQVRDAAAAGGSHNMAQMCAKATWTYRPRTATNNNSNVSGTSDKHCAGNYRQTHEDTPVKRDARRETCGAAKGEAPKLRQGDQWIKKPTCRNFEERLGG